MRFQEMPEEFRRGVENHIKERWGSLNRLLEEYTNQATRFLFFSNSGGAVAVLGYLGVAKENSFSPNLKFTLGLFVVGIVLCGITIVLLLHQFDGLLKNWSNISEEFYRNELDYFEMLKRDKDKYSKFSWAWVTGYGSLGCFIFGVLISICPIIFSPSPAFADTFEGITIEAETNHPPYDRGFYKHWIDADEDDEDTRQEVLIEESLVPVTMQETSSGKRRVVNGLWVGLYTGRVTTNPRKLQIDHMVPLKEAHVSGARNWEPQKKKDFANDLDNKQALIAVFGGANQSKGSRDPAHWMPPSRSYWCQYIKEWVSVKKKWKLSMDQEEVDAVKKGRKVCKKYKSGDALEGRH